MHEFVEIKYPVKKKHVLIIKIIIKRVINDVSYDTSFYFNYFKNIRFESLKLSSFVPRYFIYTKHCLFSLV